MSEASRLVSKGPSYQRLYERALRIQRKSMIIRAQRQGADRRRSRRARQKPRTLRGATKCSAASHHRAAGTDAGNAAGRKRVARCCSWSRSSPEAAGRSTMRAVRPDPASPDTLHLVTLNIQHGGGTRMGKIIDLVLGWDADVLVLTEFRLGTAAELLQRLGTARYAVGHPPGVDPTRNSVLIASRHGFTDERRFAGSSTPGICGAR